jgi:hypothetical protein
MLRLKADMRQVTFLAALVLSAGSSRGADIGGLITSTVTITEDSQLVDDVTCAVPGAACIVIGASRVRLDLNGFTMTGQADPEIACNGSSTAGEIGISIVRQTGVVIRGPGLLQRFRNFGIVLNGAAGSSITDVTVSTTCMSGIFLTGGSSDNQLDSNVSVRSGHMSLPCGGI